MSDYQTALEAAGAEVLCFESFGSYQGDWWAKVVYNGEIFWVHGHFGSCSGCDSFQAEFGYNYGNCKEHYYLYDYDRDAAQCPECALAKVEYQTKLAEFGKSYLNFGYTQIEAEKSASENLDWDMNAQEMVDFIKKNAIDKPISSVS